LFVTTFVVYVGGLGCWFGLVLLEAAGIHRDLPELIGAVIYLSSIFPVIPAGIFCCGLVVLAFGWVRDSL
jgi:hypothetical protein